MEMSNSFNKGAGHSFGDIARRDIDTDVHMAGADEGQPDRAETSELCAVQEDQDGQDGQVDEASSERRVDHASLLLINHQHPFAIIIQDLTTVGNSAVQEKLISLKRELIPHHLRIASDLLKPSVKRPGISDGGLPNCGDDKAMFISQEHEQFIHDLCFALDLLSSDEPVADRQGVVMFHSPEYERALCHVRVAEDLLSQWLLTQ
ncbi:hypothetical protein FALBO_2570 [Fusarium albosuccineum]|uniref:Uncharacterized protein n=1 Tax=Fusarium albosuccineum TaxID=1237068 RepID=A0A8H4LJW3_9HYPO|nr:hypothetical protein FALBO_2570 [Fusarium albosuccineum]